MYQFFKLIIGDILSVLTGNNSEGYEPTRVEYIYFLLLVFFFILTGIALTNWFFSFEIKSNHKDKQTPSPDVKKIDILFNPNASKSELYQTE